MILGETALSFLGLGLQTADHQLGHSPDRSANVSVVALYPWLLFTMVPVILVILAFNFLG